MSNKTKNGRPWIPAAEFKKLSPEQKKQIISGGKKSKKVKVPKGKKKTSLQKTLGDGIKGDVRVLNSGPTELSLRNQTKAITVEPQLQTIAIQAFAIGYVSKALERGFSAFADSQQTPFYALTYLCEILTAYVQGAQIPITQLPYWLLCFGHAISPKTVRFGQGSATYRFSLVGTNPIRPNVNTVVGYLPYGYVWSAGWNEGDFGVKINMFPTVITSPTFYSEANGQQAFQQLCQFMCTNVADPAMKKVNELVPSTLLTPFIKDVSAFAVTQLWQGVGGTGTGGGWAGQAQLEVPIFHPMLSLLAVQNPANVVLTYNRFFTWSVPVAGDPIYLGASLCDMYNIGEQFAKRMTKFHPVNFLEFANVLAMWVQYIVQANFNDNTSGTLDTSLFTCPLTLQEVMLILRNTLMGAFKETQSAVQGLLPYLPTGSSDNQFAPFISGTNTCCLDVLDMHLPVPFIENIRALVGKKICMKGNDVVWWCPVLGMPVNDNLKSSDYLVEYPPTGFGPVSVFQTGALFQKRVPVGKKGEFEVRTLVEDVISMFDGASGASYVFINDPPRLKSLVATWNTWLTTSGVATFSCELGSVGTEKGITALSSITMARHVSVKTIDAKHVPTTDVDIRSFKTINSSRSSATVFHSYQALADTSQGTIISTLYEQVLGVWILPFSIVEFGEPENSTLIQRWQFQQSEPFLNTLTTGVTGITVGDMHAAYAARLTKSKLGVEDDWVNFFKQMAAQGRGGILSSLAAGFVGSAFPQFKGIADTVAELVPF